MSPNLRPVPGGRSWIARTQSMRRELAELEEKSPVFRVLDLQERPDEMRILATFGIPTLVVPKNDEVRMEGPVVFGIRYLRSFLREPPPPFQIITIVAPEDFFHPNGTPSGGLCCGHPPVGIRVFDLVHLAFAAVTLQSSNPREWDSLNQQAADFVRRHVDDLPLLTTGLYEEPPRALLRHMGHNGSPDARRGGGAT